MIDPLIPPPLSPPPFLPPFPSLSLMRDIFLPIDFFLANHESEDVDREAQRAIRERTKLQIEDLEKKIRELTSQQPYRELQAGLRAKEAVEAENADIKRRLASIVSMIQPLLASTPPGMLTPRVSSIMNYKTGQLLTLSSTYSGPDRCPVPEYLYLPPRTASCAALPPECLYPYENGISGVGRSSRSLAGQRQCRPELHPTPEPAAAGACARPRHGH